MRVRASYHHPRLVLNLELNLEQQTNEYLPKVATLNRTRNNRIRGTCTVGYCIAPRTVVSPMKGSTFSACSHSCRLRLWRCSTTQRLFSAGYQAHSTASSPRRADHNRPCLANAFHYEQVFTQMVTPGCAQRPITTYLACSFWLSSFRTMPGSPTSTYIISAFPRKLLSHVNISGQCRDQISSHMVSHST